MKNATYPLALPPELLGEVKETASHTGISMADAMRQSIKLGLPKLKEQLQSKSVKPMTPAESKEAFAPDEHWDKLESVMARRHISKPRE